MVTKDSVWFALLKVNVSVDDEIALYVPSPDFVAEIRHVPALVEVNVAVADELDKEHSVAVPPGMI